MTQSSPTGSQILQAVGCAEAGRYLSRHPKAAANPSLRPSHKTRRMGHPLHNRLPTTASSKKSASRTMKSLTFRSATELRAKANSGKRMNAAALGKLPVIFCVEDNGYAISVPVEVQTAGRRHLAPGLGIPRLSFRRSRRHRLHCQLRALSDAAAHTAATASGRRSCTRT